MIYIASPLTTIFIKVSVLYQAFQKVCTLQNPIANPILFSVLLQ